MNKGIRILSYLYLGQSIIASSTYRPIMNCGSPVQLQNGNGTGNLLSQGSNCVQGFPSASSPLTANGNTAILDCTDCNSSQGYNNYGYNQNNQQATAPVVYVPAQPQQVVPVQSVKSSNGTIMDCTDCNNSQGYNNTNYGYNQQGTPNSVVYIPTTQSQQAPPVQYVNGTGNQNMECEIVGSVECKQSNNTPRSPGYTMPNNGYGNNNTPLVLVNPPTKSQGTPNSYINECINISYDSAGNPSQPSVYNPRGSNQKSECYNNYRPNLVPTQHTVYKPIMIEPTPKTVAVQIQQQPQMTTNTSHGSPYAVVGNNQGYSYGYNTNNGITPGQACEISKSECEMQSFKISAPDQIGVFGNMELPVTSDFKNSMSSCSSSQGC